MSTPALASPSGPAPSAPPRRTPPTSRLPNKSENQLPNKPTNRQVGKLASWQAPPYRSSSSHPPLTATLQHLLPLSLPFTPPVSKHHPPTRNAAKRPSPPPAPRSTRQLPDKPASRQPPPPPFTISTNHPPAFAVLPPGKLKKTPSAQNLCYHPRESAPLPFRFILPPRVRRRTRPGPPEHHSPAPGPLPPACRPPADMGERPPARRPAERRARRPSPRIPGSSSVLVFLLPGGKPKPGPHLARDDPSSTLQPCTFHPATAQPVARPPACRRPPRAPTARRAGHPPTTWPPADMGERPPGPPAHCPDLIAQCNDCTMQSPQPCAPRALAGSPTPAPRLTLRVKPPTPQPARPPARAARGDPLYLAPAGRRPSRVPGPYPGASRPVSLLPGRPRVARAPPEPPGESPPGHRHLRSGLLHLLAHRFGSSGPAPPEHLD